MYHQLNNKGQSRDVIFLNNFVMPYGTSEEYIGSLISNANLYDSIQPNQNVIRVS